MNCLCKYRKELEKIENGYKEEYSKKYGEMLLNKRCNPLRKKETKHFYEIDNEENLHKRAGLEKKIIKECNNMYIIDTIVKELRVKTKSRFSSQTKEKAFQQICKKKEDVINKLITEFE